jgi:phosphopentomutase
MPPKITSKKIIDQELNILGERVYEEARVTSRKSADRFAKDGRVIHRGGSLRKSINFRVKSQRLTMSQFHYGQYQHPNELMESIQKHAPESIKVISINLVSNILKNAGFKK